MSTPRLKFPKGAKGRRSLARLRKRQMRQHDELMMGRFQKDIVTLVHSLIVSSVLVNAYSVWKNFKDFDFPAREASDGGGQ